MGNTLKPKGMCVKIISLILVAAFIIYSILYITPSLRKMRSEYRSAELKKVMTVNGNITRTDYVDDSGRITVAADVGYATKLIIITDEGEYEKYLNEQGEPIDRYSGYYGIFREYDDGGNPIRITYLNLDDEPTIITQGYAIEEREYDEENRLTRIQYYDTGGAPILTSSGYGKAYDYTEDGKISRITYLNIHDQPMVTSLGYASLERQYYNTTDQNNGRVENEFYFDVSGNPVALSLGQYGVHKEYDENGKETVITYLDADGNPTITTKGYTTVLRTYQANNSIATEQYYDVNGEPYSIGDGQYGYKKVDGQVTYLNKNGRVRFNIKTLLYNHSRLIIPAALLIMMVSAVVSRRWNLVLMVVYLVAIVYLTLMFRESGDAKINLNLFWSYKKIISDSEMRADILKNIWLFIPLGTILYLLKPSKVILFLPVMLSIFIELIQYSTGTGLCELDDVMSNSIGAGIGFFCGECLSTLNIKHIIIKALQRVSRKNGQLLKKIG